MLRLLPLFLEVALLIICLIDAIQTPAVSTRNLPKWAWLMLIILVPIVGPLAWLFIGRPKRGDLGTTAPTKTTGIANRKRPGPVAPDDDLEFLAKLSSDAEQEDLLKKWEKDLKRREDELRERDETDPTEP